MQEVAAGILSKIQTGFMVSVMPPEYFPRLSYVALMDRVSQFVMADTFQYSRQSFHNRARVRSKDGAHWLTVPLSGGQTGQPQCGTNVSNDYQWKKKHLRSFVYSYHRTPFFTHYEADIARFFEGNYPCLSDVTMASVELTHRLFGLKSELIKASALEGQPRTVSSILRIIPQSVVLLPPQVAAIEGARNSGIQVFNYYSAPYRQSFPGFFSEVMALDLLFNYGEESRTMLRQLVRSK